LPLPPPIFPALPSPSVDPKFLKNLRFAKKHNKVNKKPTEKAEKATESA
jgi:hypothetical protein